MENERLGVLEAEMRAHFRADETGFERINADTAEIKTVLRTMAVDLKTAVERIHSRIDEEAGKARHATANTNQVVQAEIARVEKDTAVVTKELSDRVSDQKVQILGGVVTITLAVIAWLADHFLGGKA